MHCGWWCGVLYGTVQVGTRLYCACLSFHEAVSREKLGLKEGDDVEDDGQQVLH